MNGRQEPQDELTRTAYHIAALHHQLGLLLNAVTYAAHELEGARVRCPAVERARSVLAQAGDEVTR